MKSNDRGESHKRDTGHRVIQTLFSGVLALALGASLAIPAVAQEILPFPPKPSGSIAAPTMRESVYSPLPAVTRLPKGAPNILIVLIDDVGPAQTDTYGGEPPSAGDKEKS